MLGKLEGAGGFLLDTGPGSRTEHFLTASFSSETIDLL